MSVSIDFLPRSEGRAEVISERVEHLVHHVALFPGEAEVSNEPGWVFILDLIALIVKSLSLKVFLVSGQLCFYPIIISRLFYL